MFMKGNMELRTTLLLMSLMSVTCSNPGYKRAGECYVSIGYNIDYQGTENRTSTGAYCVNWKDTTWNVNNFDGSLSNNFCRNPDKDKAGPWCITQQGNRETCNIPKCAASAMFDGRGNIEHYFNHNTTEKDNISFVFYTNEKDLDDATILTVQSWESGSRLDIKLGRGGAKGEDTDAILLEWRFQRNKLPVRMTSTPNLASGRQIRVDIVRDRRNLTMTVDGTQHLTVIDEEYSETGMFRLPGIIYIGKSPFNKGGFVGCIADVTYNNIRTLDIAMGVGE